jgi:CheY-like chemotaxis protein
VRVSEGLPVFAFSEKQERRGFMPKGSRVLMADDDKMLIDMYKERLELAGYIVTLCRNGEEALSKLREAKPDIILLDIMMPKINGYEALASIKSDPATKDIPVIMLSALMRDFNREKAVEAGADDYLIKSEAMPADVITKIEQVLSKYGKSTVVPAPSALSSNIPAPSATPPNPAANTGSGSTPLPDLPPSPTKIEPKEEPKPEPKIEEKKVEEKPKEPEVPFVAPTPDASVMQPDAPKNIVFTPANHEPKDEPKPEPKKEPEEVPVIKINPMAAQVAPAPTPQVPWDNNKINNDLSKDKKGQSLASIALVVAIAMLLTTLVNDIAIYFFFFANK